METGGQTPGEKQYYIYENESLKKDLWRVLDGENIDEYESEKLASLIATFNNIVEQLNLAKEYTQKADELGIRVKKDFTFDHLYHAFFNTTTCKEPVDWKEFSNQLDKYVNDLKNAIELYYFNQRKKI